MKTHFLIILLFCFGLTYSQDSTRVQIQGKIIVASPDIEGITIYNKSSNKGTVTNEDGEFEIKAAINDKINVHSLQFKDFDVIVGQDIIETKKLNIYLVEQINKLDEVVILPYDLTGVLAKDVEDTEVFTVDNPGFTELALDISAYELANDEYSKVENLAAMTQNERIRYQANGMALLGSLVGLIFKKKDKNKSTNANLENAPTSLNDTYNHDYFTMNFKIPEEKVEAFIAHVEANNFDINLLKKGEEIHLIEHLNTQSKEFLKPVVEKD